MKNKINNNLLLEANHLEEILTIKQIYQIKICHKVNKLFPKINKRMKRKIS